MSPPRPSPPPLSVWSISTFACQQEIFPKTWEHISNLDRELRRISLNKISIQQCWLLGEELETKRLLTARVEIQCLNLNSKKFISRCITTFIPFVVKNIRNWRNRNFSSHETRLKSLKRIYRKSWTWSWRLNLHFWQFLNRRNKSIYDPRRDVRSFVSQLISKKGIEFAGKKLIKFERGLYWNWFAGSRASARDICPIEDIFLRSHTRSIHWTHAIKMPLALSPPSL